MSNMKRWLRERGLSYVQLAQQLNQSHASICQKVNRKTNWQRDDCAQLLHLYGLPSDFVQDLVPYEALEQSDDGVVV
ncbi:XRE family transcriptional regulator [Bifidobacterium pseudolongum]|uniref:XRE family transcriptional regulator n=1 Tax=Bifidobacterium pseudolongum TaxID=1694 RepID=A0A4S4F4F2_9BIFI|nr:XRE family transcriptional regulator [Bifidobacterium pseudolongum]MCI6532559.1 XRE family transcriptional regulator [Bifidobacterium animalis]MDY5041053.1 XRE family transcriptional regulator [Bifidobacterium animalis]THG24533.1 XRE family transcriptional regulator [Bifidobacterium pseudolongum]